MGRDLAEGARRGHTRAVNRAYALATTAAVLLSACSSSGTTDPSAAGTPPADFCDAMASAATTGSPAVEALNALFDTIDTMGAGATEGDLDALHTVGTDAVSTASLYAAALTNASALAPAGSTADVDTLSDYWTLYVVGLGQIAETAPTYGSLIDQMDALQASDTAAALISDQPAAQQRVNDAYIAECSS